MKIPEDFSKVDPNNLGELIWWSNHLGICPEMLLSIIGEAGSSIEVVRKNIDSKHNSNKVQGKPLAPLINEAITIN